MRSARKSAKQRGRPALPPTMGKRHPLNMRTTREIKEKLEAVSRESGRSLAQEVEYRIEQSLREKERLEETLAAMMGGAAALRIFRYMAAAADAAAAEI